MAVIDGLSWTFDTVAEQYGKFRPGYSEELYRMLLEYCPIGTGSRAAEIGIGAGQATLPILKTGCRVDAVECGERFCRLCREKFNDYTGFSVIHGKFEDVSMPENTWDLVYSASAFHWIPEELGYRKVYRILKPGGVFARFANHPFRDKGKPALSDEMDRIYGEYYYPYYKKEPAVPVEYTEEDARERAEIARKYGFEDIRCAMFSRTRTFSADEYISLLGTYSDHIAIEESIRMKFFGAIRDAILNHGGEITVYDTMDLQLARKPLA